MTVLVALIALCAAKLVTIWQMSTLIGKADDVQAIVRWLARMEAYRLRVAGRQKDGGNDDED